MVFLERNKSTCVKKHEAEPMAACRQSVACRSAKCDVNEVNAHCGKVFIIGDKREKYSYDKKLKVIRMYLEGIGIRSIERLEGVSAPLILKWIKGVSKIIKDKLVNTEVPDKLQNIEILEIDENEGWMLEKSKLA